MNSRFNKLWQCGPYRSAKPKFCRQRSVSVGVRSRPYPGTVSDSVTTWYAHSTVNYRVQTLGYSPYELGIGHR